MKGLRAGITTPGARARVLQSFCYRNLAFLCCHFAFLEFSVGIGTFDI